MQRPQDKYDDLGREKSIKRAGTQGRNPGELPDLKGEKWDDERTEERWSGWSGDSENTEKAEGGISQVQRVLG